MSAKKLLELLDKKGLLEDAVMSELRKQVADGKGKVMAETIAKVLVDKGHLTKFQATKLVGEAVAEEADKVPAKAAKKADDDLLDLAPFEDQEATPTPVTNGGQAGKSDKPKEVDVVMLEEADALTPVEEAGSGLTPVGMGPMRLRPSVPQSLGLEPLGDGLTSLEEPDPFAAPASAGRRPAETRVGKPSKRETRWDTKLMLGGFGTLAFLIFLGMILYWWITSEPSIKIWEAAEEAYNGGNYNEAKDKYEKWLTAVGDADPNSSKARVRIHLTKLRTSASDPEQGLKTAEELLPKIDQEKDSSVARDEYPGFLPAIPEGFIKRAQRAQQANDTKTAEELVAKARQARDLLNSPGVITTSNRVKIAPQLSRIDEDIGLIERSISQDKELAQAIVDITTAAEAAETMKGYQLYNDLLKKYPGLKNDAGLNEAVAKVTGRERTLVKVKQENLAATDSDVARNSEFRVVLATRTAGDAKLQNQVATVLYGNSAYGLDAGTGHVLWSRFLGTMAKANPIRVAAQPDSDVLLVDQQHHDLLRVTAREGKLVWRLPIGEPFTEPTAAGLRIYVATDSGRILEIDAETGESRRHAAIPQRLTVSPVVSADRPRMYQVGEHSNVYVLHTESLQCEDVIYLGHKAGSIENPPLVLMGHVFIAENPSAEYSLVHALRIRSQGDGPKLFRPQEAIRTTGRVVVPLVAYGRRLLVLTDRGEIRVFDVDSTKNENTLLDAGKVPSTQPKPHIGYALADGTTLWVADDKLTKYTVQVTRKEIVRDKEAITNVGDAFVAPLQLLGNYLIHARRGAGSTGVLVACIHVDDPRKTVWQTQLGVPAGRIAVDPAKKEIIAISSGAALFQVSAAVLKAGYADQPVQSVTAGSTALSFTEPIELENGVVAFFNPADNKQLLVYDPAMADSRLRIVPLGMQEGHAPCKPIAFLGGLLVPSDRGDVWLFKVSDGSPQVLPFQPKLEPGDKLQWRRPTTVGDGNREIVIANDRRNIYRLGIKDQPQPHLAELATATLDVDLATGLAALGDTIYGVVRTSNKGDHLVAISVSDLKVANEFDLKGGRVTWGPERIGDVVMVVTDSKELRLFDGARKERWEQPATMHGNPAGMPLVVADSYVFAGVQGAVWTISAATGREMGMTDLAEPLGAGPVAYQERLLLCGNDGTLHVIPTPTAPPTADSSDNKP